MKRECQRLLDMYPKYVPKERFPLLSAYDYVLKCSNTFNLLDARGAISVTERVGVIAPRTKTRGRRGPGMDGSEHGRGCGGGCAE